MAKEEKVKQDKKPAEKKAAPQAPQQQAKPKQQPKKEAAAAAPAKPAAPEVPPPPARLALQVLAGAADLLHGIDRDVPLADHAGLARGRLVERGEEAADGGDGAAGGRADRGVRRGIGPVGGALDVPRRERGKQHRRDGGGDRSKAHPESASLPSTHYWVRA